MRLVLKEFLTQVESKEEIVAGLKLLEPYKVLLDRIWQRVWLTELELSLVDTEPFQRLHWKLQLGTTILVYPCASHTRFEHSIGTLKGVETIIQACKNNEHRYSGARHITDYEHFLARLIALLHDLAQMAYGHTLDKEGHVMKVEWKCSKVREELLSSTGVITRQIRLFFNERWKILPDKIRKGTTVEAFVGLVRNDLDWALTAGISSSDEAPPNEYLVFISDVVGNTLSGDLLDYAQRDYVSLGMSEQGVSLLPLEFAIIKNVSFDNIQLPRLVLTLWKPSKPEKMRKDVVRYLVDLFDKRCRLAENVYFHHAKIAASAMLIKAVDLSGLSCDELWSCSDVELLSRLAKWEPKNEESQEIEKSETVKSLAERLLRRHLFKNVFECCYDELKAKHQLDLLNPYCKGNNCNQNQREFEKTLVSYFPTISDQQVAAYCPDPEMNLKPFETLVWQTENDEIVPLKKVTSIDVTSIEQRHRDLWGFSVFVDPDVLTKELSAELRTVCQSLLFEREPQYQLAKVWIGKHETRLEEIAKSRGIAFAQILEESKNLVADLLQKETRGRGRTMGLKAPSFSNIASILAAKGKSK